MGWVKYRMGDYADAIKNLRKAVAVKVDSEISAHLGEVLWVSGDQQAAKQVWGRALKFSPDSEVLKSTIKRFHITQ